MKYSPETLAQAEQWIRENGLFPQPCGASIQKFCKFLGISDETFARWKDKVEFVEMLNRAREYFKKHTVQEVANALVKAARGVDFTRVKEEAKAEKVVEFDAKTGKKVKEYTGELKTIKATRETMYFPPNVEAAKFVLTNLDPEHWKNKQETAVTTPAGLQLIVKSDEEAAKIRDIGKLGI